MQSAGSAMLMASGGRRVYGGLWVQEGNRVPAGEMAEVAGLPFGWGAIASTAVLILNGSAFGVWLKNRAANRKVNVDADTQLREEMWKDIANLKLAKEDQSRRLTLAETKIASQTVQIGQLRFISTLLVDELERLDPQNSIARQARFLLQAVQPDAMPEAEEIAGMTEVIAKLSKTGGF